MLRRGLADLALQMPRDAEIKVCYAAGKGEVWLIHDESFLSKMDGLRVFEGMPPPSGFEPMGA